MEFDIMIQAKLYFKFEVYYDTAVFKTIKSTTIGSRQAL